MEEKTFINCTMGGPISVYVKNGTIVRIRPLVVKDGELKPWTIKVDGKQFSPHKKLTLTPPTVTERAKVYSERRIKYPLKRVDFNPKGNRNFENRGKSRYERISWTEALDIVAGELRRIQENYGPEAVMAMSSSHHNAGTVGYKLGTFKRFFDLIGHTAVFDNPDSWEGYHWGAIHSYGFYWRLGTPERYDLLEDTLKNADLLVYWSTDPDSTRGNSKGQESAIWRLWFRELGKKQIFIDPFCNYTAAILGDKWIAPRPGTDAALALAIAYVWIRNDTYDKDYIANRTIGFGEFKDYVMGKEDGIPKSPEWAEEIAGIAARTIEALAQEWASRRTMLIASGLGGACRQAFAHEWARLTILLQAMQGLGKPGVNLWCSTRGAPSDPGYWMPGYADPDGMIRWSRAAKKRVDNPVKQRLYRLLLPDAVLNPPVHWRGEGFCAHYLEQQFVPYTYPMPNCSEVKMFYRYGGSFIGTMTETNKWVQMYQSPKLEFVVNQDCWWNTETHFADVILPACTNLERNDIIEFANAGSKGGYMAHDSSGCNYRVILLEQKCIEPLFESKSDYEIFTLLADRLGVKDDFTDGGKTEEDWIRGMFEISDLKDYISWDEFKSKGYYIVPTPDNYKPTPALRWFYEGRECDTPDPSNPKRNTEKAKELGTYSGKIEFVSQSLTQHFPDDEERPPMPHYIPSWEGYDSKLASKYPLQLISPHVRYSYHTHYDYNVPWLWDIPGHRVVKDGHPYRIIFINSDDAAARNIKEGDIVKVYNYRGAVLLVARITQRVRPGVVHCYQASGLYDPLEKGKAFSVDRGGCINLLTPSRLMSSNAPGMAPNSALVEIVKWEY